MSHKIGFWAVFALVTGSQIGSGVFMLPASLAPYGPYALLGWLLSGVGAVCLALVFARLSAWRPLTGGPHVYVKAIFGSAAGFFTGWTYWVISWVSSTAVVIASVGYVSPLLGEPSPGMNLALELLLLGAITALNIRGVSAAGRAEFVLTILKILPLLVMPLAALSVFDWDHMQVLPEVFAQPRSSREMISAVTMLTLWGFIGLESGTAAAGSIENPGTVIPRALALGTFCVALIYLFSSFGIMGALPSRELAASQAPYADLAKKIFGGSWHLGISLAAALVCIGTLNAWTLTSGQIALGLGEDRLLPACFARRNKRGAPVVALLLGFAGVVPLLFLTARPSLAQQISTIIDFSVTAFLYVYGICCVVFFKVLRAEGGRWWQWAYGSIGFGFCLWVLGETSLLTLGIAGIFTLSGLPFYLFYTLRSAVETA